MENEKAEMNLFCKRGIRFPERSEREARPVTTRWMPADVSGDGMRRRGGGRRVGCDSGGREVSFVDGVRRLQSSKLPPRIAGSS